MQNLESSNTKPDLPWHLYYIAVRMLDSRLKPANNLDFKGRGIPHPKGSVDPPGFLKIDGKKKSFKNAKI